MENIEISSIYTGDFDFKYTHILYFVYLLVFVFFKCNKQFYCDENRTQGNFNFDIDISIHIN